MLASETCIFFVKTHWKLTIKNKPIGKIYELIFHKKNTQMANKHVIRCSTSSMRGIQIKATMRPHFTPTRETCNQKYRNEHVVGEDVKILDRTFIPLGGDCKTMQLPTWKTVW